MVKVDKRIACSEMLLTLIILVVCLTPRALHAKDRDGFAASPNVLIIMCDQLNAHVLGCYGGPVPTPHIDRIAREGVRFTNAVCTTPFCSPSRASLITGLYPHTHGIVTNVMRRDYPAISSPATQEGIKVSERIPPNAQQTRSPVLVEKGSFMVRGAGWKYVRYADGDEYLYHLSEDPGEINNLANAASHQQRKQEMRQVLEQWLQQTNSARR